MDIVTESALKVDWEKNPLSHRGIEPASVACWSDAPHPCPKEYCNSLVCFFVCVVFFLLFFFARGLVSALWAVRMFVVFLYSSSCKKKKK